MVPDLVEDDPRLDALDTKILRVLAKFAWNKTTCFPSNQTIARRAHSSPTSIKRRLAHLVACGHIKRVRVQPSPTNWTGRVFVLLWRESEEYLIAGRRPPTVPPKPTYGNPSTSTVDHGGPGRVDHNGPRIQTFPLGTTSKSNQRDTGKFRAASNGNVPCSTFAAGPLADQLDLLSSRCAAPVTKATPVEQVFIQPTPPPWPPPAVVVVPTRNEPPGPALSPRNRQRLEYRIHQENVATAVLSDEERAALPDRESEDGRRLRSMLINGSLGKVREELASRMADPAQIAEDSPVVDPEPHDQVEVIPDPVPIAEPVTPPPLDARQAPSAYDIHLERARARAAAREAAKAAHRERLKSALANPKFKGDKDLLARLCEVGPGMTSPQVSRLAVGLANALQDGKSQARYAQLLWRISEGRMDRLLLAMCYVETVEARNQKGWPLGKVMGGRLKELVPIFF